MKTTNQFLQLQKELAETREAISAVREDINNASIFCECIQELHSELRCLESHLYDIEEELRSLDEEAYEEMLEIYYQDDTYDIEIEIELMEKEGLSILNCI